MKMIQDIFWVQMLACSFQNIQIIYNGKGYLGVQDGINVITGEAEKVVKL